MTQTVAVISQPRFIPALNYLHRMMLTDVFVWLDNVQYTPRDWENRNKVKGPSGAKWLSVPVIHESRDQRICDTKIDPSQNWRQDHVRTLEHFYGRAPHGHEMMDFILPLISAESQRLMDLNIGIVESVAPLLGIACHFVTATSLGADGRGEDLLIGLCRSVGATCYMSGSLGRNYITPSKWAESGLGLCYHDYNHPSYPQIHGDFLPWMSFLDLVANVGFAGARDVIACNQPGRDAVIARGAV